MIRDVPKCDILNTICRTEGEGMTEVGRQVRDYHSHLGEQTKESKGDRGRDREVL